MLKLIEKVVKPGDTVRYLNAVGGGKVTRVEGRLAYIDDEGFETPVPVNEVVVVLPAGHEPKRASAMFDQEAFDLGLGDKRPAKSRKEEPAKTIAPEPLLPEEDDFEIIETDYGDYMTILLGFEPENVKELSTTPIHCQLVNDSNYFLQYALLRRDDSGAWTLVKQGEAAPNELVDIADYTQQTIRELERIVFQAVAYKRDKEFEVKTPLNVSRKLDLTKFFKLHCFRPGVYFENPAIELPLYRDLVPRPAGEKKEERNPRKNRRL